VTIRQTIRDQVLELLNTDRPNNVPEFTKRRAVPGERVTEQRGAVFFVAEPAERVGGKGGPVTLRKFILAVQVIDAVEETDEADDALEPALAWVTAKLGNTNLSGLVHDIEHTGTGWESDSRELFYICATTTWRVEYQTLRADLDRRS
jgi:hypothetical protein